MGRRAVLIIIFLLVLLVVGFFGSESLTADIAPPHLGMYLDGNTVIITADYGQILPDGSSRLDVYYDGGASYFGFFTWEEAQRLYTISLDFSPDTSGVMNVIYQSSQASADFVWGQVQEIGGKLVDHENTFMIDYTVGEPVQNLSLFHPQPETTSLPTDLPDERMLINAYQISNGQDGWSLATTYIITSSLSWIPGIPPVLEVWYLDESGQWDEVTIEEEIIPHAVVQFSTHKVGQFALVDCDLLGDFDSDGTVKVDDMQLISRFWRFEKGDPEYQAQFDSNGDNVINVLDIQKVTSRWGKNCYD